MLGFAAFARLATSSGAGSPVAAKVQLVLVDLQDDLRLRISRSVIRGHRENLAHPQVHPVLAGADVTNAFEQLWKIVVLDLPGDLTRVLPANYSEFSNSCPVVEFPFGKQSLEVFIHHRDGDLELVAHERLCQPDQTDTHSRPAVHRLLEDEDSSTRRVNRAVLTVYGGSEFAVKAELERQHPSFTDIVILTVEPR